MGWTNNTPDDTPAPQPWTPTLWRRLALLVANVLLLLTCAALAVSLLTSGVWHAHHAGSHALVTSTAVLHDPPTATHGVVGTP